MRLTTTSFTLLPAKALWVGTKKEPICVPVRHGYDSPVVAVAKFARYMGLTRIPAETIEMFKTDPFYKYCFYRLKAGTIYGQNADFAAERKRLAAILVEPKTYNDRDLYYGLRDYLNNFIQYFPGEGTRHDYEQYPDICSYLYPVFKAIDRVLGADGVKEATLRSQAALREQGRDEDYNQRLAHLKFCLNVFNALLAEGQFPPELLWT